LSSFAKFYKNLDIFVKFCAGDRLRNNFQKQEVGISCLYLYFEAAVL